MSSLTLLGMQLDITWKDKQANYQKVRQLLTKLEQKVDLIVLPETFPTGFTMESRKFAEDQNSETESFLLELANMYDACLVGGWIEKNPNGPPFNTLTVATASGIVLRYHKIHPFSYVGEDRNFTAGNRIKSFEWKGFQISPLICYDLRFPEVFRSSAGETDIYLVIANWPEVRIHHWLALLKARAIENLAYVLGVNRFGNAGANNQLYHSGFSALFNPLGEETILKEPREDVLISTIHLSEIQTIREKLPFLKDIREFSK